MNNLEFNYSLRGITIALNKLCDNGYVEITTDMYTDGGELLDELVSTLDKLPDVKYELKPITDGIRIIIVYE